MSYLEKLKSKKSYVEVYMENKNKPSYEKDERLWKPVPDKLGNSYSIIRFLPRNVEEFDEVNSFLGPVYSHSFQNPSTEKWFIENCPRSLDKNAKCPVCEYNWAMFKNYDKETAKEKTNLTRGKASYYANILVLKDATNPDNNGKVFIYKFGKTIMDKIANCLAPQYEEDPAFDPFHPIEGANFILKTKKKGGYLNFDDSKFESQTPISKDNKKIEGVLETLHGLNSIIAPSNFKSYDAIKTRFELVMNSSVSPETQKHFESSINDDIEDEILSASNGKTDEDDDILNAFLDKDDSNELPF